MFATSSQAKCWLFSEEAELAKLRTEANTRYVAKHRRERMTDTEAASYFLTPAEERLLSRQYEVILSKFCAEFQPPMPKCVIGTSLAFFKRFYIHNSAMDYHPKDIMLTCVYLSCKVEEFYVPIGQFVKNLRGDREKFADAILSFELILMSKLTYHLTVHNPFRPLEGFFIDAKTRCPKYGNVEKTRRHADEFIDLSLKTDACLLFSPSQIALSALRSGATIVGIPIDKYITGHLLKTANDQEKENLLNQLQKVKIIVKDNEAISREQSQAIQKKLEICRNQENNPDSEVYKQKALDKLNLNEDDEVRSKKRPKLSDDVE